MVTSFLVIWFLCLSSLIVHFKNDLVTLIRFWQYSLASSSFILLLRYYLLVSFSFKLLLFVARFQYSQVFERFFFSDRSNFYLFGSSFPSVMCRFPLLIINMVHLSILNSIPMSWLLAIFSNSVSLVFWWILSDSKSPQISMNLLSILTDLCNAIAQIVLARPRISNTSTSLTNPLGTVPKAPILIGTTVSFRSVKFIIIIIIISVCFS